MKKLLLFLLLLPSVVWGQVPAPRVAIMFAQMNCSATFDSDQMLLFTDLLTRQGWNFDVFNVDNRTWFADTSDAEYFEKRYKSVILVNFDGHNACVLASGFNTNFRNSAGIAGTARGPLGGRWRIPVYVTATRVIPTASANDTNTTSNYAAGIAAAGSFARPAAASAGTWRAKMLTRLAPSPDDTVYTEILQYACRTAWAGAGEVAATAWVDTSNGLGSCVPGVDSIMVAWRWKPRDDRPGVHYNLIRASRGQFMLTPAYFVLQYLAVEVGTAPPPIQVPLMEHSPEPSTLAAAHVTNFKAFYAALKRNALARVIFVRTSPTSAEIGRYNSEVVATINDHLKDKFCVWSQFSNETGFMQNFYAYADTARVRQAWNVMKATAMNPDTFGFRAEAYNNKAIVTGGGVVGVLGTGKVFADAGVKIVESPVLVPDPLGWVFQTHLLGKTYPFTLPGGDNRILTIRGTNNPGEAATLDALCGGFPTGATECVANGFMKTFLSIPYSQNSVYWHTATMTGADPYAQWLYGDVMGRTFRQFKKVIQVYRSW